MALSPRLVAILAWSLAFCGCSSTGIIGSHGPDGPVIRVCISERQPTQTFMASGRTIFDNGRSRVRISDSASVSISADRNGLLQLRIGSGNAVPVDGSCRFYPDSRGGTFAYSGRRYTDTLLIVADGPAITVVNILPLERYLHGVVPNEIGRNRKKDETEAVKAQAILARTYALRRLSLPLARLFDVHADSRDQVFTGAEPAESLSAAAIGVTTGEVLEYDGHLAECYFHAACGGNTEAVSLVWQRPQSKPYLAGVKDLNRGRSYCRIGPSYRWTEDYTREEFESMIREYVRSAVETSAGTIQADGWSLLDIKILGRMPSGRVARMKLVVGNRTAHRSLFLEADNIRRIIRQKDNHGMLRSSLFDLVVERDRTNWIRRLTFNGAGSGHGIGMCQWGAIARARNGQSVRQILRSYFPGTDIARRY